MYHSPSNSYVVFLDECSIMHRYYFPNTYLNHPNYILQSIAMSKTAETYVCTCRLFMLQTIIQYRLWHASHCQFGKKVNFPVFCFFSLFIAVIHSNFFPRQQWKQARNVFTLKCIISFQKKVATMTSFQRHKLQCYNYHCCHYVSHTSSNWK